MSKLYSCFAFLAVLVLFAFTAMAEPLIKLKINTKDSLSRIGINPLITSEKGKEAAKLLYEAITKNKKESADAAIKIYDDLIPKENIGGDYLGLKWLLVAIFAPEKERQTRLDSNMSKEYFHYFTQNDYKYLKEYLLLKYRIGASLKLTEQFYEKLKKDGLPEDILSQLRRLENQSYTDKSDFVKAIEKAIGSEQTVKYKSAILKSTKIGDSVTEDTDIQHQRRAYLEDIIMFANPWRSKWEKLNEIINNMPLQKGSTILDIGSGFGFFTFVFSDIVGDEGKVYAIDTSDAYIKFINEFVKKYKYKNIEPVLSKSNDIVVNDQADIAFMCSLYHVIYIWSPELDRQPFLASIKRALKPGGYLIIADNSFANGKELHNSYVYRELIQAQLHFYGFQLEKTIEITPRRYLMIFKHEPGELKSVSITNSSNPGLETQIDITSTKSLIHIGSLDSYDITERGINAAKVVMEALNTKSKEAARKAIAIYDELIPDENFGGEYSALQWFCKYIAATEESRKKMLKDPLVKAYYLYLSENDYKLLKRYVQYKYKLKEESSIEEIDAKEKTKKGEPEDPEIGHTKRAFLEDLILFNNPKRDEWEDSKKIMSLLPFKKGDKIADIGSGSGYYTYLFSKVVGEQGLVYALDINQNHITFIEEFLKKEGIKNIIPIKNEIDDLKINDKVDYAFMCSLYHIIYGVSSQQERDKFIASIKRSLKKDGMLIIVDNSPVENKDLPYHGPYIPKELIIHQLAHYGFTFEEYHQIIPQRYLLKFRI